MNKYFVNLNKMFSGWSRDILDMEYRDVIVDNWGDYIQVYDKLEGQLRRFGANAKEIKVLPHSIAK